MDGSRGGKHRVTFNHRKRNERLSIERQGYQKRKPTDGDNKGDYGLKLMASRQGFLFSHDIGPYTCQSRLSRQVIVTTNFALTCMANK